MSTWVGWVGEYSVDDTGVQVDTQTYIQHTHTDSRTKTALNKRKIMETGTDGILRHKMDPGGLDTGGAEGKGIQKSAGQLSGKHAILR